jgi:hypothetical protein
VLGDASGVLWGVEIGECQGLVSEIGQAETVSYGPVACSPLAAVEKGLEPVSQRDRLQ